MMPYAVVAAGLAIVAATVWITAMEYRNLPARVPMSFWIDGRATGYYPRPAIWTLPIVQAGILSIDTLIEPAATHSRSFIHPHQTGIGLFTLCLIGLLNQAQAMTIETAKSPEQRLPRKRYWMTFVLFAGVALLALLYL